MGTMIRTEGLKKIYRVGHEKVAALAGVDLEIEQGEICCIVGQSGSAAFSTAVSWGSKL